MELECVLVKSMKSPERNLNELCDKSNKCGCTMKCYFGVCGRTDRWRSFSNILSSPSDMLQSPEQSAITAQSSSASQNLFIAGVQCQSTSCDSYRLVFLDNNRRPSLRSLHEVTSLISPKKSSEEASVSCPSNTLASNIFCLSLAADSKSCEVLSLGCSFSRSNFRVVGTDIKDTDFYSGGSLEILCPSGYFMQGITCRGISCAKIKLKCVLVQAEVDIAVDRDVQLGKRCDRTRRFCKANLSCKDWKCRSTSAPGAMDEYCDEEFKCGKDLTCDFGRCRTEMELTLFQDTSQKERAIAYSAPFNSEGMGSSKVQRCQVVGMTLRLDNNPTERAAIVGKCERYADLSGTVVETRFTEYDKGWVSCPSSMVVDTIFCRDRECSQVAVGCSRMNKVFRIVGNSTKLVYSMPYRAECPAGYVMQGIKCTRSTFSSFNGLQTSNRYYSRRSRSRYISKYSSSIKYDHRSSGSRSSSSSRFRGSSNSGSYEHGSQTSYKGSKCSEVSLRCVRLQKIKFAF